MLSPAQDLRFRFMGPAVGNRISAAAGIPGDPSVYYAGAASGGVWKSSDGGITWAPVFDAEDAQAIGALAVSRSNHNIVWAGTGEAWAIRDSDMMGDGIYKSADAGRTWRNMGLKETGRIGRILVHPTDPEIVYACAAGRLTGPQPERGVFKTVDGGATWQRVLFTDPDTGCSGLAMDAHDPNTLMAGTWQAVMHTYGMYSGGPGSAIYLTHDGGATWKKLEGHGLPHSPMGKTDGAIAPSNSQRVYALIQTAGQGSIWRSDDGGENWRNGSWQRALIGRAGYYIHLAVSPSNPDELYVANSTFWHSTDGGKSFSAEPWGGDTHDIWIDPTDANRILVTHDGGLYMTPTHGRTSTRVTLPIGQMYHVAVDNDVPYKIYSNMQDSGTMRGPGNLQEAGPNVPGQGTHAGPWEHNLGGCESGFTLPDLTDTNIVWATCYGNEVTRYDARTGLARSVSPWLHTLDSEPDKARYRCHWTAPLAFDPFDHNTVYYGCQMVLRTANAGMTWTEMSPDLSTRDPTRIGSSGGLVGDNLGQFYGEVVFSIAPSEIERGLVWAGTNDGKVWYTRDAGRNWVDVTANIAGLPLWGTVSKIEPSHFDAATAYIAVDFHLMDNRAPWLYKTADFGRTWTKISDGLPHNHPLAYARVVAENPNRRGMLFAGTGHAFYYSLDDGGHWKQLQNGLPAAPVSWIVVQKAAHDVVVSTYGRGLYVMEDITPLEQGVLEPSAAGMVTLVTPRPAFRQIPVGHALLKYVLAAEPKSLVEMEIVDAQGGMVARLPPAAAHAGLNRASWDLRYPPPRLVALRTTPPENPHIWEEPRFRVRDTRPITHWGIAPAGVGPIAAPGSYTVKMTVDGRSYTAPLEVRLPPGSHGTEADIQSAVRVQLKVRDDITAVSDMTNQLEWMRRQIEEQRKTNAGKAALIEAMDAIDRKMQAVEYKLVSEEDVLSDDKYFVTADRLYLNFLWLNAEIGTGGGDVHGAGDWGATETGVDMVQALERQLQAAREQYQSLMNRDVPAYNQSVAASGVTPLRTTGAPPPPAHAGRGFEQ
jgi:photosystem II stability/assembly factor-like uncharacterized protein